MRSRVPTKVDRPNPRLGCSFCTYSAIQLWCPFECNASWPVNACYQIIGSLEGRGKTVVSASEGISVTFLPTFPLASIIKPKTNHISSFVFLSIKLALMKQKREAVSLDHIVRLGYGWFSRYAGKDSLCASAKFQAMRWILL